MQINKDLMDSLMMLAAITLVLVGTTHFEHTETKWILMGSVGILLLLTALLRYVALPRRRRSEEPPPPES